MQFDIKVKHWIISEMKRYVLVCLTKSLLATNIFFVEMSFGFDLNMIYNLAKVSSYVCMYVAYASTWR